MLLRISTFCSKVVDALDADQNGARCREHTGKEGWVRLDLLIMSDTRPSQPYGVTKQCQHGECCQPGVQICSMQSATCKRSSYGWHRTRTLLRPSSGAPSGFPYQPLLWDTVILHMPPGGIHSKFHPNTQTCPDRADSPRHGAGPTQEAGKPSPSAHARHILPLQSAALDTNNRESDNQNTAWLQEASTACFCFEQPLAAF